MKYLFCCFFSFLISSIPGQDAIQRQSDSYTRYELLDPFTNSFRIIYDVSATTAGKTHYFNTLRRGSKHLINQVTDGATGMVLNWKVVDGKFALNNGHPAADEEGEYLMVELAYPIPAGGEYRLRIDKTYKDPTSYFADGENIVFHRRLGIPRNSVVLPRGYEIVSCNYPVQVAMEETGHMRLSTINRTGQSADVRIAAKKLNDKAPVFQSGQGPHPWPDYQPVSRGRDKTKARLDYIPDERARSNREIEYFLLPPETNSFRLFHDYTESRPGHNKYLNIVRKGSKASDPEAYNLDTGEALKVETLVGTQISDRGIDIGRSPDKDTEVVVIWYPTVQPGTSIRLRIWETYTDPNRYLLYNDELIWDRSFGRNRNKVILPEGWWLTSNSIPGLIDRTEDGRVRLYYINDRPDNIDVHIRARRK